METTGNALPTMPPVTYPDAKSEAMMDPDVVWATAREYEEIRVKRRIRAGVPPRFLTADLGNFAVDVPGECAALNTAKYYVKNFQNLRRRGSGMVFLGGFGTGKTRLACSIVNELSAMGVDVLYTKFPAILNRIRRAYNPKSFAADQSVETKESIVDELVSYDLLVLDEVARIGGAADEQAVLYDLVDGRYEKVRPTIACTNLNRPALIELMSERLVDRLADQRGAFVPFDWKSRRG